MNKFGVSRKSMTNPHYVTIGKTGGGTFCAKSEIANIMIGDIPVSHKKEIINA